MLVFDIETNGLLDNLTHVKCLNLIDTVTGSEERYTDSEFYEEPQTNVKKDGTVVCYAVHQGAPTKRTGDVAEGLRRLQQADCIGGQNVIDFDLPAIRQVYPKWTYTGKVVDTRVMSRVMYTNLYEIDIAALRKKKLPAEFEAKRLIGTHKLESWGLRLGGELKADFKPQQFGQTWNDYSFSEACDDYCMQDVRTNVAIFEHFASKNYDPRCLDIEHRVQQIITRQQQYGWMFNTRAAEQLAAHLQQRKVELEAECAQAFKPWYRPIKYREGRNHKVQGTTKGADWNQIKWFTFNPGSRDHIADRLITVYGWAPTEFTPKDGKPKVDETILETLPYPEAKKLAEFFVVNKTLAQVSDGKQGWLKKVHKDGRMHGGVNTNGAVTGRMTHSAPNVAQCPKVLVDDSGAVLMGLAGGYGYECRSLYTVPAGKKLVGCDADGLELRMLAHYMARHDGGAYIQIVVNGKKAAGTDVHTMNQKAIGLNSRDNAKTWIYAFLYGAGNTKLGTIVYDDFPEEKKARFNAAYPDGRKRITAFAALGKKSRDKMAKGFPALAKLVAGVKAAAKANGYLIGLDGRRIHVRSQHAALNSLLQSAGAVVMKQALVHMFDDYDARWVDGEIEPVGNIHDEVQLEADEEIAHDVAQIASDAVVRAGVTLGLRCPLAAGADIGDTWAETH